VFALSKSSENQQSAQLVVWGTIPEEAFTAAKDASSLSGNKQITFTYVRKDPAVFNADLVEALSNGQGPDIIMLRDDNLFKNRNKIFTIPYQNYTERMFKDTFIEGAEVNMAPSGILAVPFMIDPLVMYWNRDIFTGNLLSKPPKYWDEFYASVPGATSTDSLINLITRKDVSANITQSALSLGEYKNVNNAKEILSMLLLQSGTPITTRGSDGLVSVLNSQFNYSVAPSYSAVNFYTQFSNPTSPSYTWNRSLPNSLVYFLSGKLATYIGFASEIFNIQAKNPNLNFDVTYVPQIRQPGSPTPKQVTFAHIWSLAIVKQSPNIAASYTAIMGLTESSAIAALDAYLNLPPVRRDLLSTSPSNNPYLKVFYDSSLFSHTWLDPDAQSTDTIFRDMIESITSGRARTSEALSKANDLLQASIK
jgi:ABC-type glycerol-3-phosphate transport system substrate-binding protein